MISDQGMLDRDAGESHSTSSSGSVINQTFLASISGRAFEDLKFFAISPRNAAGGVDNPIPLFASSTRIHDHPRSSPSRPSTRLRCPNGCLNSGYRCITIPCGGTVWRDENRLDKRNRETQKCTPTRSILSQ